MDKEKLNSNIELLTYALIFLLGCSLAMSVDAENFQPVVVAAGSSFYNLTIVICDTNSICDNITNTTFYSATNRTSAVVYLEDFNSSYNKPYYYTIYIDDVILSNQTKAYLGRSTLIEDNLTVEYVRAGGVIVNDTEHDGAVESITGSNTVELMSYSTSKDRINIGQNTAFIDEMCFLAGAGGEMTTRIGSNLITELTPSLYSVLTNMNVTGNLTVLNNLNVSGNISGSYGSWIGNSGTDQMYFRTYTIAGVGTYPMLGADTSSSPLHSITGHVLLMPDRLTIIGVNQAAKLTFGNTDLTTVSEMRLDEATGDLVIAPSSITGNCGLKMGPSEFAKGYVGENRSITMSHNDASGTWGVEKQTGFILNQLLDPTDGSVDSQWLIGGMTNNVEDQWMTLNGSGGYFTDNVEIRNNLTVDTNTFFVDNMNNRVGIGTTVPLHTLEVIGDVNISGELYVENIYRTEAFGYATSNQTYTIPIVDTWYYINYTNPGEIDGFTVDSSNSNLTVITGGGYDIYYDVIFQDASPSPNSIIAVRVLLNGVEMENSYKEVGIVNRKDAETSIEKYFHIGLAVDDNVSIQYIASDTDVTVQASGTYTDDVHGAHSVTAYIRRIHPA